MSVTTLRQALLGCVVMFPVAALAGPCSDDIAAVGKQLSQSSSLGPVSSGTLTASTPGTSGAHSAAADQKGTSADQRVGGTAGTKEIDAASSNVATSDADVRQQQLGKPTAASQGKSGGVETAPSGHTNTTTASDDKMSRAKMAWQKAVDLNAQNDPSCHGAVDQARSALQGS